MDMKTSKRIPPGTPKYHRLTGENRIIIWTLKKKGKSKESLPPLPRCQKRRKTRNRDAKKYRNGVVRKVLPRGSAFDAILDGEMRRIDRMLNDRPLKCRNGRTPREAFTALLHRHLLAAA